jgi:hypothetical protein
LLPEPEDGADEEALEGADRLALALALTDAAGEVGPRCWIVPGLGEGDAVDDGIEPTIAAAIETVAALSGG